MIGDMKKYSSFSELNQVWDKKKTFKTQALVTRIKMKNLVIRRELW
jgi:hypothetical protein